MNILALEIELEEAKKSSIVWTDYFKYRASLRGFEIAKIENILRYSVERYVDTTTRRRIAVGRHDDQYHLR